jgi:mannitol-specific phosphotransferase system IIBC component
MKIVLLLFIPAGALISKNLALILAIIVAAIIINSSSINLLEGMENNKDNKENNEDSKEENNDKDHDKKENEDNNEDDASVQEGTSETFKTIEDLRKERCKSKNGKKIFIDNDGKELTLSEISDKYPYIDFENDVCNPCDEKCSFTLNDRISDEEVLRRPKLPSDDE